ncbi:hypothetical protein QBC40DRAFT_187374 [Triangularia verruculosa]|uniref:Pentatricopeptide repeat-containing protein-mitochondrial domain-containing protein n=1 Tax=Triangularia verruculosa TaxID=2587418 RepID=A0AAN6X6I1_9PEZI|nr:hypothetical protein QBC40DRAFT_187374 [Triangularia verruculosa]
MTAPRQAVDGLWRCLCPSIDAALLRGTSSVQRRFTSTAAVTGAFQQQQDGSNSSEQQQRSPSSAETQQGEIHTLDINRPKKKRFNPDLRSHHEKEEQRKLVSERTATQLQRDGSSSTTVTTTTATSTPGVLLSNLKPLLSQLSLSDTGAQPFPLSEVSSLSTPQLLHVLDRLINRHKHVKRFTGASIRALVDHLVKDRGVKPDELIYRALVVANLDPDTGSAWELEDIIKEMDKENIAPSEGFWRWAVKVLAVHPDYTLRNLVLRRIGVVYGEELVRRVREDVILGLMRERQEEGALELLEEVVGWEEEEEMEKGGGEGKMKRWMSGTGWDTVVFLLGQRGHTEEAWGVFMRRLELEGKRGGGGVMGELEGWPMEVWYFMLEECSRENHLEGTKFLWGRLVEGGLVVPSDGMLNNILNTGARHCDEELATGAFRELAARGTKMTAVHYEALVDCYADQGKLEEALEVLSIKAEAFSSAGHSAETRSILRLLVREPEMANRLFEIMKELQEKGRKVPASGPWVLLEFVGEKGDMEATIEAAERVLPLVEHDAWPLSFLCSQAKTVEDWILIAEAYPRIGPSMPRGKALFALDEMVRHLAVDRQGDLDLAFARLWDMGEHLWLKLSTNYKYPTDEMLLALLDRCYWERDSRIWAVIDLARKTGIQVDESDMEKLGAISKPEVEKEILVPSNRLFWDDRGV